MKIEEGMYVRTTKGIGKVDETEMFMDKYFQFHLDSNKGRIHNVTSNTYWNSEEDIIEEPSEKIINLIKKGDLVELTSKYCEDEIYRVTSSVNGVIALDCLGDGYMTCDMDEDIKRVLTKEQYAAMSYEVKHDN